MPLNDPFYNLGGIKDKEREIMSFIESSINEYNNEFKPNKDDFLCNETLQFLNIRDVTLSCLNTLEYASHILSLNN